MTNIIIQIFNIVLKYLNLYYTLHVLSTLYNVVSNKVRLPNLTVIKNVYKGFYF